jgi:type II secretory pathway predicted ATPase ExeA
MSLTTPFDFADFQRALENLQNAFRNEQQRYLLLTGHTGTGKTMLCQRLRLELDRCRYRILYFSHARRLNATGFVRVVANALRVPTRRSHSETLQSLVYALHDEPYQLLLCFDEAHELPEETLAEARALAESDLAGNCPMRILLVGMPPLRDRLQAIASLWRRIGVREELTGLTLDELPPFLHHHFGAEPAKRICQEGMRTLFERGRGIPGIIVPMFRRILAEIGSNEPISPLSLDDILQRWELT